MLTLSPGLEQRGLTPWPEATELEVVGETPGGREHRLIPPAAAAWRRLQGAALADGVELFIVSAFRTVARQGEILERKLASGVGLADALAICAPPGYSEHHSGRALDLATPGAPVLDAGFADTAAYAWLLARAGEFDFSLSYPRENPQGFLFEPWHWFHGLRPASLR